MKIRSLSEYRKQRKKLDTAVNLNEELVKELRLRDELILEAFDSLKGRIQRLEKRQAATLRLLKNLIKELD